MIFSGLDWGTMLAAAEDIAVELERSARRLREIVEQHRPVEPAADPLGPVAALGRTLDARTRDFAQGDRRLAKVVGLTAPQNRVPETIDELVLVSAPIPGLPGWRVDDHGRKWYSDAWLDGPKGTAA